MSERPAELKALILAGGSGTRFWPSSRLDRPKQLLALGEEESLLRQTVSRLKGLAVPEDVWVCTTRRLADAVANELPEVPREQILAEPEGRDTAPAIAWSIDQMAAEDVVVAVLPADHRVAFPGPFRSTLARAAASVSEADRVMTLGVVPTRPETGFGYLELGEMVDSDKGVRRVSQFKEKPDAETASAYIASGSYLWNAGIFVFRGGRLLELIAEHEPQIATVLSEIRDRPTELTELYAKFPKISIDFAVMERCDDLATLPLDCGWSDLGSWAALAEVLPRSEDGNATQGEVVAIDAHDNILVADSGTVAVVGVSELVVVRTDDTVLVVPRERAQDVKALVEELRGRRRNDLL